MSLSSRFLNCLQSKINYNDVFPEKTRAIHHRINVSLSLTDKASP